MNSASNPLSNRTENDSEFAYQGNELDLFSKAQNWKKYWGRRAAPFIRGHVLDVGSGQGNNLAIASFPGVTAFDAIDPDPNLTKVLHEKISACSLSIPWKVHTGFLADLPSTQDYETILYIDVLEHIENDSDELAAAAERLRPGGCIVALSPAHPYLFSPFDEAVGHFRRYTRTSITAITPKTLELCRLELLDSVGYFASLANRLILSQKQPGLGQILFWDRFLVKASRLLDPCLQYRFGKSVLAVWTRK
jgi:SAM-dependent methyltransferase